MVLGRYLGTQNRLTLGLASSYCVLCLNPIKGIFNTVSILTHTHTHTHTSKHIIMALIIPKPNHSSIMAYHNIP